MMRLLILLPVLAACVVLAIADVPGGVTQPATNQETTPHELLDIGLRTKLGLDKYTREELDDLIRQIRQGIAMASAGTPPKRWKRAKWHLNVLKKISLAHLKRLYDKLAMAHKLGQKYIYWNNKKYQVKYLNAYCCTIG